MNFRTFKLPSAFDPRDYQINFLEDAVDRIKNDPTNWHLYTSPTGTGKSIMEWMLLAEMDRMVMITPRIEIIAGMLEKMGHYCEDMAINDLVNLASEYRIFTPIRFRNVLAKGYFPFRPDGLLIDEAHHNLADTYQDIHMYLNGVPVVGLTATPYRGTPNGTQKYLEQWNNTVNRLITLADCFQYGYCSLPTATVWPMVDDDVIDITNGEFNSKKADEVISDRLDALVTRVRQFYDKTFGYWDRATMFSFPSSATARLMQSKMDAAGLPAMTVTQDTTRVGRSVAFNKVVRGEIALIQIDVVSEGVDLPIRRLIDCKPTMSPVRWVQQIGRIMRPITPDEGPPEYICCCRNLERHAYLMEGMLPNSTVRDAQNAFGDPTEERKNISKRVAARAVGLEGVGRFTITPVQLLSGMTVFTYNLVHTDQFKRTEYYILVHPNQPDPVYAHKVSIRDQNTDEMKWGKWRLIESIPDLKGCQSVQVKNDDMLTERQINRWNEDAEKMGLNPHQKLTNRKLQTLFFLKDIGARGFK